MPPQRMHGDLTATETPPYELNPLHADPGCLQAYGVTAPTSALLSTSAKRYEKSSLFFFCRTLKTNLQQKSYTLQPWDLFRKNTLLSPSILCQYNITNFTRNCLKIHLPYLSVSAQMPAVQVLALPGRAVKLFLFYSFFPFFFFPP